MGLKRPVSDEETSPVKLSIEAEATLSVLSPISSPVQFRRRLSKYQKVLSPGVTAYASNVVACYGFCTDKSVSDKLDGTLKCIKAELDARIETAVQMARDWSSLGFSKANATRRKELEEAKERRNRALKVVQHREALASRPIQRRRLQFAGGRELQALPRA